MGGSVVGTKGMVAAGRVGMVYKGIYSESKNYSKLDAVSYQNSIYIAKRDSTGILPTDTEYWILSITGQTGTAESVAYDGTESGLIASNVQAAIDELSRKGSTGTVNYNELENRPSIDGMLLQGNKTLSELGIQPEGNYAPIESPILTGTPKAPTPLESANDTQIATTAFVKMLISNLINGAPETLDTLKEIADALGESDDAVQVLNAAIGNKVDKIEGKGLSTNDFTTAEKNKLDGIATGAEVNVQSDWNISDSTSDAFIKNKPTIPTKTSQLTNDSGYKTTDNNTWKQNTKTSEGYVPAGNGHANQVWGTDANGKPMWKKETGKTPINNLLATVPGSPLDATQGKKLKDELTALNDNLGYKTKIIDGVPHWSPWGADTWSPFSNFLRKKLEILSAESLSPINGVKNSAQNAIDGDLKNHYLADNPTQAEIVFTLKQAASIREIHVIGANSTSGTLYFGNVIAYGSSDNIDFTQIASAVMCPLFYANLDLTGLGFTVIPVQNYEIYKYIKLIAYGSNCGFYEVEIVG